MTEGWLEGKVALVVGGAAGIGRGVVDAFRSEGARVAVLDRSADALATLRSDAGGDVAAVAGDVRRYADNERAVAAAVERFGRLDALIVCAGITDHFTSLEQLDPAGIDAAFTEVFEVNVKGAMLATKAALPALRASGGNIVLTLSNAAFLPGGGGPLYTGSKFGLRGVMTQLSHELAPRIRVNAVAPGGTVTSLRGAESLGLGGQRLSDVPEIEDLIRTANPLEVVPEPQDHAWAYVYLASPERTRAVTGCVVRSDGGLDSRGLVRLNSAISSSDM